MNHSTYLLFKTLDVDNPLILWEYHNIIEKSVYKKIDEFTKPYKNYLELYLIF